MDKGLIRKNNVALIRMAEKTGSVLKQKGENTFYFWTSPKNLPLSEIRTSKEIPIKVRSIMCACGFGDPISILSELHRYDAHDSSIEVASVEDVADGPELEECEFHEKPDNDKKVYSSHFERVFVPIGEKFKYRLLKD